MKPLHAPAALVCSVLIILLIPGASVAQTVPPPSLLLERAGGYGYSPTFQVALGDLDGDGDLDAVFSNMSGRSEIWINDGSATFSRSYQNIGNESHGVAIGDLDGDGDEDLILAYASESIGSRVYWNDGSAGFTPAEADLGDGSLNSNAISLFDAEGDGDLDVGVYYAERTRHCRVYLNLGDGQFDGGDREIPGLATWGDVDGDGDVDAVTLLHQTNGGSGFQVFLNDGGNGFTEAQHLPASVPYFPGATALGDIDGDGDLDVIGGGGSSLTSPVTIFLNNGDGSYEPVPDAAFGASAGRITLGDFNRDGLVDVYLASLGQPQQIGISDGAGDFTDSGIPLGTREMLGIGAIGDLDGDGDPDLFISVYGNGGPNEVWLNVSE